MADSAMDEINRLMAELAAGQTGASAQGPVSGQSMADQAFAAFADSPAAGQPSAALEQTVTESLPLGSDPTPFEDSIEENLAHLIADLGAEDAKEIDTRVTPPEAVITHHALESNVKNLFDSSESSLPEIKLILNQWTNVVLQTPSGDEVVVHLSDEGFSFTLPGGVELKIPAQIVKSLSSAA